MSIKLIIISVILVFLLPFSSHAGDADKDQTFTYILVHGATGGAWDWLTVRFITYG